MTFRRALPLVAALSLVFNSLLTASAQLAGLQLEQHSISAVSGGLKLTFSFNQTVEAYSLSELMLTPYNKAGEPDFGAQVPVQKPLSGKKLEFMFPSSKLVNVSAVEYRLLVKDGGGAQVYQSSLLKLDAGYLSDYAQKLTQIEQLNSRLKAATDDASRKQELLDSYGKVQADQIEFQGVSFVTDSKIVLSYKLNAPGAIKVKLTSLANPQVITERTITTSFGSPPIAVFERLVSGEKYKAEADIVRIGPKQGESLVMNKTNVQTVATEKAADIVSLSDVKAESQGDTIKVSFNATSDGLVQIRYAEKIAEFQEGTPIFRGQITKDDYGKPQGGEVIKGSNAPNVFTLDRVQSGKKYVISVTAMNKHGIDSASKTAEVTLTAVKPLAFDPTQPLSATITPLGITLEWKATIKPKDASFTVIFDNKTWVGGKTETIGDDLTIALTLPVNQLGEILAGTNEKKNAARPILRAQMTDKQTGQPVMQDLRLVYSIPTKEQVDTARQKGVITEETKKDLYDVINNAVDTKNVNWSKLISTGLSFLLKRAI